MDAAASESSSSSSAAAGRAQGGWRLGGRERNVSLGQHTAVVVRLEEGDRVRVVEQNGDGKGRVREGWYAVGDMRRGK